MTPHPGSGRFGSSAFRALRVALLAIPLVVVPSWAFLPLDGLSEHNYTIRGFLDRVPEKTRVLDQLDVSTADGRRRKVFVTGYLNPGDVPPSDGQISRDPRRNFTLRGAAADVGRLMRAPAGATFQGTFVVSDGSPGSLLLTELADPPAPERPPGAS